MFPNVRVAFYLGLVTCTLANVGFTAEEEEAKHPFSVKLVDEDGKAVEGAKAGVTAYFGSEGASLPIDDGTGWRYLYGATSDAKGIVNILDGRKLGHMCVVARHPARELVGIWKIDPDKLELAKSNDMVIIKMQPATRISGKITSPDLVELNRPLGFTYAYLKCTGGPAFGCQPTDHTFHFFAPPGDYELMLYGADLHEIDVKVSVKPGQRELDLGAIDIPATRLALMIGKPVPELPDIQCWKNSHGVKLADLKGKCVILDFWGYWCGPCVHQMPELFKLHAKYHDQGLEIVGIHVDLGTDEKEPVDTVDKLDRKLVGIRKDVWKGKDVPYPVAIVTGKETSYGTAIDAGNARSPIAALYGVLRYPTLILIDRQGNVVRRFYPHLPDHMALLEKLLKDQ
jgi:thiol-disulfide isomerase/thioredoxin